MQAVEVGVKGMALCVECNGKMGCQLAAKGISYWFARIQYRCVRPTTMRETPTLTILLLAIS